ncbi:MAG: hypothetical protein JNJ83_02370 [Verrucomicrobiaceae bacterium]|nr:hypothetical protein [Verrucomicrobiaceae bacterium]
MSAQTPVGKVVIYDESTTTIAQDVRGDTAHGVELDSNRIAVFRDSAGRVPTGVTASSYSFVMKRIWVFDIGNLRHASVVYGTFPRVVTVRGRQSVVMKKLFDVSDTISTGLPFAIIPTYPAPSEQWVAAFGSEGIHRHQTAGKDTPGTTTDDVFAAGVSQQGISSEIVIPEYTLFGLTGRTQAWTGKATERPLTLQASKLSLSTVSDADKSVFPEVMGASSVELFTEMVSNFGRDRTSGFPGYCYSSMTSRIAGGRLTLNKSLTYKSNDAATQSTRTVEGALSLIRTMLTAETMGYTEDDFDKWE